MEPWENDQILAPVEPKRPKQPWEADAVAVPATPNQRVASGILEAAQAGWEGSATGLVARRRLPDVVLDAHHSKWYEKLVASGAQMVSEFPEMMAGAFGGAMAGGAAGTAVPVVGNAVGAVVGGGAGAFALPTAIRTSLTEAYSKGEVQSAGDFLERTGIVVKATGKDALIGGLTAIGGVAAKAAAIPLAESAVAAGRIGATTAKVATTAATMGAEGTVMTVAPAALEGRLPEPEDFTNAAILMVGMKAATGGAAKLRNIYAKTGVRPEQVAADAKADPVISEELAKPGTEIPEAYREAARQQNAQDAVPGVKVQEVAADPFGPVKQLPGEPAKPTEVNYNYINTTEDAKGAMSRLSQVYEAEIQTQRRGTVNWDQTQMEAGRYVAELLGSTDPYQPREPGTAAGAAELLARKQMLQGAAEDMAVKAREIQALGTNATPEQTASFLASIDRAAMIQAEFLGARAEAGRALNILKETKVEAQRAQQIQDVLARFGKDPKELAAMLAEIDNPASALKFAKDAVKATTWDKFIEAYKASLVSGPITQVANLMGNVSFIALRPPIDAIAATFGMLSRSPERVSMAEPLARIVGNIQGVADAIKLAKLHLMEDTPGGKAEHRHAIEGTAGYIVRTPFRLLSAADQIFRTMNERGEAYTLATNQAVKEGLNVATREFRERVAELTNNPTEAMIDKIEEAGARFTFNAPLGEKGRSVNQLVRTWHLEWAIPFIATPGNVFKEMARLTPAAPIVAEWRADFAKGGPEAAKAMAEVALGTGLSAMTMGMAMSGHISGAGDPDANKRRVQMAAGWQPYSIKIGDKWYSYQRFQPVGTLLGFAADMAEAWHHMTPEEHDKVPKILATAFANSVTNQTFLQGMATVVDALSEPDRKGPKFIQNLAASAVPAVIGQTAQLMDPYMREINSVKEAVQNRIPGLRQGLAPQRDPFGEPIASPDRLGGVSPVTVKEQSEDKVRTEAARLAAMPGSTLGAEKAPKSVQLPSLGQSKIGKVELTSEQRDVFGDVAGHMAYQVLAPIVNSPGWEYMPPLVQEKAYKLAFEKGNQFGKNAALSPEQRQKEIQRITQEISKRLKPASK